MSLVKIVMKCDICGKEFKTSEYNIKGKPRFIGLPFMSSLRSEYLFGGRQGSETNHRCEWCEARLDVAVHDEAKKIEKETPKGRANAIQRIKNRVKREEK